MYILINRLTKRIIEQLPVIETVDNFWVKSNEGSHIQLDTVDIVEVDSVPNGANYYIDGKFTKNPPDVVAKQKESLQSQLDELDRKSVRDAEDILEALVAKGVLSLNDVPFVKQRKQQKEQLRQQLKDVE